MDRKIKPKDTIRDPDRRRTTAAQRASPQRGRQAAIAFWLDLDQWLLP
jgi:hypothetical protein